MMKIDARPAEMFVFMKMIDFLIEWAERGIAIQEYDGLTKLNRETQKLEAAKMYFKSFQTEREKNADNKE